MGPGHWRPAAEPAVGAPGVGRWYLDARMAFVSAEAGKWFFSLSLPTYSPSEDCGAVCGFVS